ncbi:hypothetical protein DER29_3221 [Micromonospora sp. M71_S20]|uniref:M35 family metallo-endopeptidase n=1 Tax=Micromonospora sp. M71_S20 TaxID=592872 RepID=UPI000EAF3AFC|nr:M35 family metallo-endopeptidase [Micromonospora sp. M71_S20]RLK25232.1 hypothetical protein DER29_3221 [Micromonospora sp. M71_S20]
MFPFPDEATRKALDLGRREVFQTYRVLMACELQRLRPVVRALPAGLRRDRLTARLDKVAALAVGTWLQQISERGATMHQAATLFKEVQDSLDGVVPSVVGNPHLTAALDELKTRIVDVMNDDRSPTHVAVNTAFARLFGSTSSVAKARFAQTVTALRALLTRTDGRRSGFVCNLSLPDGMGALASGQGDTAIINVGRSALDGTMHLWELAATLVHEGTHILADNPTVDIVYRHRNAAYYLQGQIALQNAANFEQTVYEALGQGGPFPTDAEVAAMRGRSAPRTDSLHTVLASRITRAWVRTYDFTCLDFTRTDLPKPVALVLTDLPQDRAYAPLTKAYMEALHAAMLALMRAEERLVVRAEPKMLNHSTVINSDGTIRFTINSDLAAQTPVAQLLHWMLDELVAEAKCQIPKDTAQLLALILGIEKFDRDNVHDVLNDFYGSFH